MNNTTPAYYGTRGSLSAQIAECTAHRDACMQWARHWRHKYPDGVRNNVNLARHLNQRIVKMRKLERPGLQAQ